MKRIAVYPGSFDPPTYGHIDVIKRALPLFDKIVVSVLDNPGKHCLFSIPERIKMLRSITRNFKNIEIHSFRGLLMEYARKKNATAVIRGLRVVSDFEYEFQMAQMNRELNPHVETLFMMTGTQYAYLSSSAVKEIAKFKGNIKKFVPSIVEKMLKTKLKI